MIGDYYYIGWRSANVIEYSVVIHIEFAGKLMYNA